MSSEFPSSRSGGKTAEAGASPAEGQAWSWSLVLHAVRIPHEIMQEEEGWRLMVRPEQERIARRELARYEEENRDWPPPRLEVGQAAENNQQPLTILLLGSLFVFYIVTGPWSAATPWFAEGAVSRTAVLEGGEWWRLITGLTLHADAVHLLSNLAIGGILLHFLLRLLGNGVGVSAVLLAGGGGNGLNVLLRGGEHLSVGFSTAVFGTVGLLSGLQLTGRANRFRNILLALGAGGALLALLGTEGERTDLGAHLWGFLVGLGLGSLLAVLPGRRRLLGPTIVQIGLLLGSGVLMWSCWVLAFSK